MKFFLIVACASFVQICSSQMVMNPIPNTDYWSGLTDADIEKSRDLFQSIRGISSQAVSDLVNVLTAFRKNHVVVVYIEKVVDDVLINHLNANTSIINPPDVLHYYSEFSPTTVADELSQQIDITFSQKLTPDQKSRVMTFIRGFQVGTTPDRIDAALSYLYGISSNAPSNTQAHFLMICCLIYALKLSL